MVIRLINWIRYCTICFFCAACATVLILAIGESKNQPIHCIILPRMQLQEEQQLQRDLEAVVANSTRASSVHQTIQQTHPSLAEITISSLHHPTQKTTVKVIQEKPYLIINDTLVLTEHGHIASINAYPIALQENALHVQSDSLTKKDIYDLYDFMSRLPGEILQNHVITWHNQTSIALQNASRPYLIIATQQTIFDHQLINAINTIIDYQEQKQTLSKNKTAQWIMDVRCKNQIILARQKGEKS